MERRQEGSRTEHVRAIGGAQYTEVRAAPGASMVTIGEWTLNVGTQRLTRDGETHVLDPKTQSVLLHLVERAPDVVRREDLMSRTWPDVVVGENVVDQAIAKIRRVFGDDARHPKYIETLPRRGYRLIAAVATPAVKTMSGTKPKIRRAVITVLLIFVSGLLTWWHVDDRVARAGSIVAVMSFSDLSPDKRWSWLAEALAFELTDRISDIGMYEVLPRAMVAALSPSELPEDVDLVLDGFVQDAAVEGNVRVGVQLIKLPEGHQLWSESFDGIRKTPDQLQQQIAARVSRFFHDSVAGTEFTGPYLMAGPKAPEARTAYLNYLRHNLGGEPEQLRIWLERTLQLDPTWSLGWLRLSGEYVSRAGLPGGSVWADKARAALTEARLQGLADDNPFIVNEEAQLAFRLERDYSTAERLYRRAVELEPAFAGTYALLMLISGLTEEAEFALTMLTQSFRHVPPWWAFLAQSRAINGDLEGAYDAALQYENLNPPNTYSIWQLPRFLLLMPTGRTREAQQHLAALDNAIVSKRHVNAELFRTLLAFQMDLAAGDIEAATAAAEMLRDADRPGAAGVLLLILGDQRASEQLDRASRFEDPAYVGLGSMMLTSEQRGSVVYHEFLSAMGLTPEWRQELCSRASNMPPESFISCDPEKYAQKPALTASGVTRGL